MPAMLRALKRLTMIASSRHTDQGLIENGGATCLRFSFTFSTANRAGVAIV